ncbi:DUF4880 domain-containing protein [Pigmentiphaga aceris]|uniref:DUF4880 domain-containing protein n=1 Tax=Pigmentiphaga aceris TaxID=1940612 RepID=A0A5C0AXY7_9BURK|nr:FecR domain-containing protein [Pigmentiphaga aceris]QEI07329.1 DUF4880 domain-containing protein [Pigmentiphaga aceris]
MNPRPDVVRAAIDWMVDLQSGVATAEQHEACRRWREASPEHALAWSRLQALGGSVQALPGVLAHATLDDGSALRRRRRDMMNRRGALGVIAMMLGAGASWWAVQPDAAWHALAADWRSGVGERRDSLLADGTRIQLNTDTAIDARYDEHQRLLILRRGEILITTAPDRQVPARPFRVRTRDGLIRALGTRFLVRQYRGDTVVAVFDGAVEVLLSQGAQPVRVDAGRQLRFDALHTGAMTAADADAIAWIDGAIVARDMRLDDFLDELGRHRAGVLRCEEAVAGRRISGAFPLADTDRALAAVARTLDLRIDMQTRWWVTVRARTVV